MWHLFIIFIFFRSLEKYQEQNEKFILRLYNNSNNNIIIINA